MFGINSPPSSPMNFPSPPICQLPISDLNLNEDSINDVSTATDDGNQLTLFQGKPVSKSANPILKQSPLEVPELLRQIFSYLLPYENLIARLVNKKWKNSADEYFSISRTINTRQELKNLKKELKNFFKKYCQTKEEPFVDLKLCDPDFTNEDLRDLPFLLRSLDLSECNNIDDEDVAYLSEFLYLETLNLSGTKITGVGFKMAEGQTQWRKLKNLYLCRAPITEEGFEWISKLELHSLDLSDIAMTSKSWKYLCNFKKLYDLNLSRNEIADFIDGLIECKKLIVLNISGCFYINAKHLENLADNLKSLEYLDLSYTEIIDEEIKIVSGITTLKELNLDSCGYITEKCIEHLFKLKKLNKLFADSTKISMNGSKALRKKLNTLTIFCEPSNNLDLFSSIYYS